MRRLISVFAWRTSSFVINAVPWLILFLSRWREECCTFQYLSWSESNRVCCFLSKDFLSLPKGSPFSDGFQEDKLNKQVLLFYTPPLENGMVYFYAVPQCFCIAFCRRYVHPIVRVSFPCDNWKFHGLHWNIVCPLILEIFRLMLKN